MSQKIMSPDKQLELSRIQVLSLAEGFFHSSIIFSLLKLNLFELIGEGTKTLNSLAEQLNTKPGTLARLLNAGIALGLLQSKDGVGYSLSPASRMVLLSSAEENYIGDWILNLDFFRTALSKLDESVLASGPSVDPSTHVGSDREKTRKFTLAMHNYAFSRGKELANFLDTSGCSSLLDLGCGPGTYAFHLGEKNPNLQIFLMDRPEVLDLAKEIRTRYEITNKVNYLPREDVLKCDIPGTYDLILVSNTLHMIGEEGSLRLLKELYKSINPGGSIVIQANFMNDDHMGDKWSVFVDIVQLCTTLQGKNHSVGETKKWLTEAGFKEISYHKMSFFNNNSFLRGYKK